MLGRMLCFLTKQNVLLVAYLLLDSLLGYWFQDVLNTIIGDIIVGKISKWISIFC